MARGSTLGRLVLGSRGAMGTAGNIPRRRPRPSNEDNWRKRLPGFRRGNRMA